MTKLTNAQVRAELERILENHPFSDLILDDFDVTTYQLREVDPKNLPVIDQAFVLFARLLAESQLALGEIIERGCYDISPDKRVENCPTCEDHIKIARKHYKGGK